MKLLLATSLYPPEIAEPAPYVKRLAQLLSEKHTVTIVAYTNAPEKIPGVRIVPVQKRRSLFSRLISYTVALLKEARGFDYIIVQNATSSGLPAILVGKLFRIPVVVRFFTDEAWERASHAQHAPIPLHAFSLHSVKDRKIALLGRIQNTILRQASLILVPSRYLADHLTRTYKIPEKKIHLLSDPAERDEIIPLHAPKHSHELTVLGPYLSSSGLAAILRAIKLLEGSFPDVTLSIIGEIRDETVLKQLSDVSDVARRVSYLGHVSRAELWYRIGGTHVGIFYDSTESTLAPYTPFFKLQAPVIVSDALGKSDQAHRAGAVTACHDNTPEALAEILTELFNNPKIVATLTEKALRFVSTDMSWEHHCDALLKLIPPRTAL